MPNFDDDGNYILDPEEDDPERTAVEEQSPNFNADIGEYIRRMQAQSQMVSAGNGGSSGLAQYSPAAIGPAETKYRQTQVQTPLKQNFHPSGVRKVLGMLAGGATGDPNVRDNIINSQYNKAQGDFQQKLGVQAEAAKEEENATQRAATQAHLGAQTRAEEARRGAESARGRRYDWMISPEGVAADLTKTRAAHPGSVAKPTFHEAKLKDGSLVSLSRDPTTGQLKDVDTGTIVHMNAIDTLSDPNKSLKETKEANMPSALAGSIKAREIIANPDKYDQPTLDAAKEYIAQLESGKPPQAAFGSIVAKRNTERKAKGQPEMSSKELEDLQTKLLSVQKPPQGLGETPEGDIIRLAPGVHAPNGTMTPQQRGQLNLPTTATRGRAQQASVVIDAGNDLKQFITQNQDKLGNVDSYWKQFINGTPMSDPTIAEFQTRLASYAALQAAAHGFRGSNVMKDFEAKIGGPAKNPAALVAAINGIETTMKELQKSGGTSFGSAGPVQTPTKRYNPVTGRIEAVPNANH